jgi:hypothetical protein
MSLRRGNYGYDAPCALITLTGVATVATVVTVAVPVPVGDKVCRTLGVRA